MLPSHTFLLSAPLSILSDILLLCCPIFHIIHNPSILLLLLLLLLLLVILLHRIIPLSSILSWTLLFCVSSLPLSRQICPPLLLLHHHHLLLLILLLLFYLMSIRPLKAFFFISHTSTFLSLLVALSPECSF